MEEVLWYNITGKYRFGVTEIMRILDNMIVKGQVVELLLYLTFNCRVEMCSMSQ